jgi:hypothetical protein
MSVQKNQESNAAPAIADGATLGPTDVSGEPSITAETGEESGLLARHGGKLAVGAAAMLGLAAFYHWRESRLAKDDEEEFARLQRLKAALHVDEPTLKRRR